MDQKSVLTKAALNSWQIQVDRSTQFINSMPDDQLEKEIAPGKNRGVYLVGHLAAIHDVLPEILGLGKRAFPNLQPVFIDSPDSKADTVPPIQELRKIWTTVHDRLNNEFQKMSPEDWFSRHESMTDAEFEKDPARNKLSVLLSRTGHIAYHLGQLRLLK